MIYRCTIEHASWGKAHILACKCGVEKPYPVTNRKHVCPICMDTLDYLGLKAQRDRQPERP